MRSPDLTEITSQFWSEAGVTVCGSMICRSSQHWLEIPSFDPPQQLPLWGSAEFTGLQETAAYASEVLDYFPGSRDGMPDAARNFFIIPDERPDGAGSGGLKDGGYTLMNETEQEIIIVTALRKDWMSSGTGGGGGGGGGVPPLDDSTSIDPGAPPPLDEDELAISKDSRLGELTPVQQAAVQKLIENYFKWLGYFQSVRADTVFRDSDGNTATAAQILSLFAKVDFRLYAQGFDHNNSGSGKADYNGGNPILHINIDELVRNMSSDFLTSWYFTHEVAHMTDAGRAFNEAMYQSTSPGGVAVTPQEWRANEQYANGLGEMIAQAAVHPYGQVPPGGTLGDWTYSGGPGQ